MLDDGIMRKVNALNLQAGTIPTPPYPLDYEYSGEEEVEYESHQPMSLEQQKEELKRKLQMISSKGKAKGGGR
jgi:hypothetical protein